MNTIVIAVREATNAVAGDKELGGVSGVELRLDWQSGTTPNLDIIDLPGLVSISLAKQPENISDQIQEIVEKYVEDKDTIIMCVFSGVVDAANFRAIKVAQKFDEQLSRTLVVITKLDMFQPFEEQKRCLLQHLDNLRGFDPIDIILVKNSGGEEGLDAQLVLEREFVEAFRPVQEERAKAKQSFKLGTPALVARLTGLLVDSIVKALPSLKGKLETSISTIKHELEGLPQVLSEKGAREKAVNLLNLLIGRLQDIQAGALSRIITHKERIESTDIVHANLEDINNKYFEQVITVPSYVDEKHWDELCRAYNQRRGNGLPDHHAMEAQFLVYFKAFVNKLGESMSRLVEESYQCVRETYDSVIGAVFRDFVLVQREVRHIMEEEILKPQKAALMLYIEQTSKAQFDMYTCSPIYTAALSYYGKAFIGNEDSVLMPEVMTPLISGDGSNDSASHARPERMSKAPTGALGVETMLFGESVLSALAAHIKAKKKSLNTRLLRQEQWMLYVYNIIVHNSLRDMVPRAVKLFLMREVIEKVPDLSHKVYDEKCKLYDAKWLHEAFVNSDVLRRRKVKEEELVALTKALESLNAVPPCPF